MPTDVVFDFFGTLVEYDAARLVGPYDRAAHAYLVAQGAGIGFEAFRETLGAVLTEHEEEARRTCREPTMLAISRAFLTRIGMADASDAIVQGFTDRYIEEWGSAVVPLAGLGDFLAALGRRFRLSVISNTFHPPLVHGNLARLGLRRHFAEVITSAELGIRKPDGRIFAHAQARLGVGPERAVHVGDSLQADYMGARAAGWRAYLVDPARSHPELGADRLDHLFQLADALGR